MAHRRWLIVILALDLLLLVIGVYGSTLLNTNHLRLLSLTTAAIGLVTFWGLFGVLHNSNSTSEGAMRNANRCFNHRDVSRDGGGRHLFFSHQSRDGRSTCRSTSVDKERARKFSNGGDSWSSDSISSAPPLWRVLSGCETVRPGRNSEPKRGRDGHRVGAHAVARDGAGGVGNT